MFGSKKKTLKNGIKRPSTFDVWKYVITSSLTKNLSSKAEIRDYNFYASSTATFSGQNLVTYYYTFDSYGENLPVDFKTGIRNFCTSQNRVRVSFIESSQPTTIDWSSARMRSQLRTMQQNDEEEGDVSQYNYHSKFAQMDLIDRRKRTLVYLTEAQKKRGRKLLIHRVIMMVKGERGELFDKAVEDIETYIKNMGIKSNRVESQIETYLRGYSPLSMRMTENVTKLVGNPKLTDEIVSRFSTFEQGQVGNGRFYMGTDIESGLHVYKDFKYRATDAENMVIAAATGAGKSFYTKVLSCEFLIDDRFNMTILDWEGDEYTTLCDFVEGYDRAVIINMAEGSGVYYDPVEINLMGTEDDSSLYSYASNCAVQILTALSGSVKTKANWVRTICENVVRSVYERAGVSPNDQTTWHRSRGLTLHDCYRELERIILVLNNQAPMQAEDEMLIRSIRSSADAQESLNYMHLSFYNFFDPKGKESATFQSRVSLQTIGNAKLVICSFGMRSRDPSSVDERKMALSQIFSAYILHMRSMFSKSVGKFNVKLWEEFQRQGHIRGTESVIRTTLTGGRKMGDVSLICTNEISVLLGEDKFKILENTQSYAIGALGTAAVKREFCESQEMPEMLPELNKIMQPRSKQDNERSVFMDKEFDSDGSEIEYDSAESSEYENAFLLVFNSKTDVALVKMQIPEELSKSRLFQTGVAI